MMYRRSAGWQRWRWVPGLGLAVLVLWAGVAWALEYNRAYEDTTIRVLDVARDAHRVGLDFIVTTDRHTA